MNIIIAAAGNRQAWVMRFESLLQVGLQLKLDMMRYQMFGMLFMNVFVRSCKKKWIRGKRARSSHYRDICL